MSEDTKTPSPMAGRAQSDGAKRRLLDRLYDAWLAPEARDMRLGQLIVNACRPTKCVEVFNVEDERLIERIEALVRERERA